MATQDRETSVAIPDAVLAIRTFPRRYREALGRIPADRLGERPAPETSSALEHVIDAADVLQRLARALPQALDEAGAHFAPFVADNGGARSSPAADADAAVAVVSAACQSLAARADATPWEAWDRVITVGDDTVNAGWIVQHAAVVASDELRGIERVGRLVGAPGDD